ncbi:OmpH family outer membrane protein [Zhouia sp. PK063]|uniref:OmpH family outer membrane protein n=1 Tax=Zhouia sp. PK063 TaxID=3373602 RepID=UPI0037AE02D4
MKQIKTLVIAFALVVGASSFANAQSKEVAHINVQDLIQAMPDYKTAQAELQKKEQSYQADIKSSTDELQNKITLYRNEAPTKTEAENEKRAQEVDGLRNNLMQAQQMAQQEMQKKQVELIQPIMEKARTSIQKVARAQGFKYVLDSSPGSGVILADGKDLMPDVKKDLGM